MRLAYALLLFTACATSGDLETDEVEVDAEVGKSDEAGELRVRTGETTVWVTKQLARRTGANGPEYVLRGRASRNVTDGMAFVNDDPYGDFAKKTARTFEVTWPVSTARTLVDGVDQFVRISFTRSTGRPDSLTARAVVRPRLDAFEGSSKIYLTAELTPVVYGGTVVYRLKGKTTSALSAFTVLAGDQALTDVRRTTGNEFEIDLAPDHVFADAPIQITAVLATGQTVTKRTHVGLALKKLGLTAGDAYDVWPRPECTAEKRACLTGLGDGAIDLAPCGEAFHVLQCAGQVGVFVDDVAFLAALDDGRARTASAAFRADARALVGEARVDQLQYSAEQTVEAKLQRLFGRWYLGTSSRTTALTGAIDAAMLDVYARPHDLVEPIEPQPGNAAVTRQIAADALLAALAAKDFTSTEFARSYDQLVTQYRAQHVAAIRAFRETIDIEPHAGNAAWDVMVGNWLDPYVEVSIDRATGTAANVYIEID